MFENFSEKVPKNPNIRAETNYFVNGGQTQNLRKIRNNKAKYSNQLS